MHITDPPLVCPASAPHVWLAGYVSYFNPTVNRLAFELNAVAQQLGIQGYANLPPAGDISADTDALTKALLPADVLLRAEALRKAPAVDAEDDDGDMQVPEEEVDAYDGESQPHSWPGVQLTQLLVHVP